MNLMYHSKICNDLRPYCCERMKPNSAPPQKNISCVSAIPKKEQVSQTCYSEICFFYMPQMLILILVGKNCALALICKTPAQHGLYLGYSLKAQYCRYAAFISYKLDMSFLIQHCLMLYAEHRSAVCYNNTEKHDVYPSCGPVAIPRRKAAG